MERDTCVTKSRYALFLFIARTGVSLCQKLIVSDTYCRTSLLYRAAQAFLYRQALCACVIEGFEPFLSGV